MINFDKVILTKSFYNRSTLEIAQDLLGCFLVRKNKDKTHKYKIVETEAYDGPFDLASHAARGQTPRNQIMFGEAGIIYVYLTYGMHFMLNIVTGEKNYPAAILIRAVEPEEITNDEDATINYKTNGPAKLTKTLKINKNFNGLPIYTKKHNLWIESRQEELASAKIKKAKRVGVDYAGKYKDKLWRFYIKDNKFVSKK